MLCPVAQGCCGLLLWQDIREGLVVMDIKNYPISHPRKSFIPGNITSGLLFHHTAFIPQYRYAGLTESKEATRCIDSLQIQVIPQYLISEWG